MSEIAINAAPPTFRKPGSTSTLAQAAGTLILPGDAAALSQLSERLSGAPRLPSGAVFLRAAGPTSTRSPTDIAQILGARLHPRAKAQEIRAFHRRDGRVMPVAFGEGPEGIVGSHEISRVLKTGATVVFQKVDALDFGWHRLARAFEGATLQPVQANLYATARETDGLSWHRDPHDVLVLQLAGRKRFFVADDLDGERPVRVEDVLLVAGDLLWMRRGVPHCARSEEGGSLHASVGLLHLHRTQDGTLNRVSDALSPTTSPGNPALLAPNLRHDTVRFLLDWRPLRHLPPQFSAGAFLRPDLLGWCQDAVLETGHRPITLPHDNWVTLTQGRLPDGAPMLASRLPPAASFEELVAFLDIDCAATTDRERGHA